MKGSHKKAHNVLIDFHLVRLNQDRSDINSDNGLKRPKYTYIIDESVSEYVLEYFRLAVCE
mgnify:CR=1 FL=1